jgi:hypothetical protein
MQSSRSDRLGLSISAMQASYSCFEVRNEEVGGSTMYQILIPLT